MDYLFNRNFLLLLTVGAIINTSVQGILTVSTGPSTVEACIGSHTTINCTFHEVVYEVKVNWYFNEISDFDASKKIRNSSVRQYHEEKGKTVSSLTIRNVTFNDSGWYFCEVTQDIPQLIQTHSNGTQLVIYTPIMSNVEDNATNSATTRASETPNASPWWLWVAVAVGCILTVTAVIITTVICGRKKEDPVYVNTSKSPWKEDRSLHHGMPSKGCSNKQMDTLKPHNYECRPKESPVYENTKEVSRSYGKKD